MLRLAIEIAAMLAKPTFVGSNLIREGGLGDFVGANLFA
jgi:hypothetical protein